MRSLIYYAHFSVLWDGFNCNNECIHAENAGMIAFVFVTRNTHWVSLSSALSLCFSAQVGVEEEILQPSAVLEWPDVYADDPSDSGLDLDFDEKKIMLNYLTVSDDAQFIVGCTDVNIVCVWKLASAAVSATASAAAAASFGATSPDAS